MYEITRYTLDADGRRLLAHVKGGTPVVKEPGAFTAAERQLHEMLRDRTAAKDAEKPAGEDGGEPRPAEKPAGEEAPGLTGDRNTDAGPDGDGRTRRGLFDRFRGSPAEATSEQPPEADKGEGADDEKTDGALTEQE